MKRITLALSLGMALVAAPVIAAEEAGRLRLGASSAEWTTAAGLGATVLTVVGPAGRERLEFPAGVTPHLSLFDRSGQVRPDGVYRWEIVVAPAIAAKRGEEGAGVSGQGLVQSGTLAIRGGAFDQGTEVEPLPRLEAAPQAAKGAADADGDGVNTLITDNLYVQASICTGFDCVNNEAMGFDTIRLKENNLRIKFDDTSTAAGFPNRDWQITANDSASGGANKFSIEDITGGRIPFTIEAAAPTNSVFVDSSGRVGFRTSTPVLDLHVSDSDSPGLRLEQNTSGGFAAQTWDVAGNETNFFVRDVTNGSTLPFRIRPGAPSSSLFIDTNGNVGVGTSAPSQKLHVRGTGGTTQYLVEEASATSLNRVLMSLRNTGPVSTELINTDANGTTWRINNLVGGLALNNINNPGNEALLSPTGTMTVVALVQSSDRNLKSNIVEVDGGDILARLKQLPVATWTFRDNDAVRHLGPMAQDFKAIFDLGESDTGIAPLDVAGVSLAAVKALSQELDAKNTELATLKSQNADLAARLAALETAVAQLADGQ